ncbi:helix-turn-helix domain-containing protein [Nonomuraea sp. NPDC005692]|uniref:helix-turn-helix domain-containing protein n=1 Tax=Nonomuraea sp. NPDC005692 TaxID=3157168 RepID=UPI0033E60FEC
MDPDRRFARVGRARHGGAGRRGVARLDEVEITVVNLSIRKNGHAKAIRFATLTRLCEALGCQPGDLLTYG